MTKRSISERLFNGVNTGSTLNAGLVACLERADLLALVGDVYCIFCYVPMWYSGSGVLDCIVP